MAYDFSGEMTLTFKLTESQALKLLGLIRIGSQTMNDKGDFDPDDDVITAAVSDAITPERERLHPTGD